MRIVILGAGHLGYTIAELLSNEQHDVVVADSDEEKLSKVRDSLDVLTITANGTSPDFTRDPDIRDASVFVAVTEMDEVNILASMLAKKMESPTRLPASATRNSFRNPPNISRKILTLTWF